MASPVLYIIIGGCISLVSALSGIILQHILSMKKMRAETRQHPFRIVYNKQTEFFDALAPILVDLNIYITTLDVWLHETSAKARLKIEEAAENNQALTQFDDLLQKYYMYLPEKLIDEATHLRSECIFLSTNPKVNKAYKCINLLFSFQNTIREFVGIEKLSEDFLKAFSSKSAKYKQA